MDCNIYFTFQLSVFIRVHRHTINPASNITCLSASMQINILLSDPDLLSGRLSSRAETEDLRRLNFLSWLDIVQPLVDPELLSALLRSSLSRNSERELQRNISLSSLTTL